MSALATALLSKALGLPADSVRAVIVLEAGRAPVVRVTRVVVGLDAAGAHGLTELTQRFALVERPQASQPFPAADSAVAAFTPVVTEEHTHGQLDE